MIHIVSSLIQIYKNGYYFAIECDITDSIILLVSISFGLNNIYTVFFTYFKYTLFV